METEGHRRTLVSCKYFYLSKDVGPFIYENECVVATA